jgi:signal transduction histidine kinase
MRAAQAIVIDLLLAGAVLLAGVVQWATRNFADLGPKPDALPTAPDAVGLLLVTVAAAAVLLRRGAPLAALALTCGASITALALRYGVVVHLGPAVVLYEIARRDMRRLWWVGGTLAAASLIAIAVLERELLDASGDFAIDAALWAAAAGAGAWQRRAHEQEAEIRRREQTEAAADERARIARELHDSAGHAITTIAAHAGAARVLRARDPDRADAAIATVEQLARQAMTELDEIVTVLRDDGAELHPLSGLRDLDALIERASVPVEITRTGAPRELSAGVDRAAYRIAQEAITNAARHGAGTAHLHLRYAEAALEIEVANPAGDTPTNRRTGGRGIAGMRERATLLGGTLSAGERDGWFTLRATLPYTRHVD